MCIFLWYVKHSCLGVHHFTQSSAYLVQQDFLNFSHITLFSFFKPFTSFWYVQHGHMGVHHFTGKPTYIAQQKQFHFSHSSFSSFFKLLLCSGMSGMVVWVLSVKLILTWDDFYCTVCCVCVDVCVCVCFCLCVHACVHACVWVCVYRCMCV